MSDIVKQTEAVLADSTYLSGYTIPKLREALSSLLTAYKSLTLPVDDERVEELAKWHDRESRGDVRIRHAAKVHAETAQTLRQQGRRIAELTAPPTDDKRAELAGYFSRALSALEHSCQADGAVDRQTAMQACRFGRKAAAMLEADARRWADVTRQIEAKAAEITEDSRSINDHMQAAGLRAAEAAAEALAGVTEGPWACTEVYGEDMPTIGVGEAHALRNGHFYEDTIAEIWCGNQPEANARFIAYARQGVPDLVAALTASLERERVLREALSDFSDMPCETIGLEDMEGVCCRTCRARRALGGTHD